MPFVITAAASFECFHGGAYKATGDAKLCVNRKPVLVLRNAVAEVNSFNEPICPVPPPEKRCLRCISADPPAAKKLQLNSAPALLEGFTGVSNSSLPVTVKVDKNAMKIKAI